jgi:hypothetical protein
VVESLPSKQVVAGSSPVSRSTKFGQLPALLGHFLAPSAGDFRHEKVRVELTARVDDMVAPIAQLIFEYGYP